MITKIYILAPNCVITRGYSRAILADLQKEVFKIISFEEADMLSESIYESELFTYTSQTTQFLNQLIQEDILLLVPEPLKLLFPEINNQFHNAAKIDNGIIELSSITIPFGK